jgi:hypothetical protein
MQIENAVLQKAGELQRRRRNDDADAAADAEGDAMRAGGADQGRGTDVGRAAGGASDAAGNGASKELPSVVRTSNNAGTHA